MSPVKHVLFIYVDASDKIYDWYKSSISSHNVINSNSESGFDLFCPDSEIFEPYKSKKIDFRIQCAMFSLGNVPIERAIDNYRVLKPTAYYMYARSSISKTNFRLANNVGIIDSGYRGNIGAYFDAAPWSNDDYIMKEKQQLVQLCHPNLEPFYVVLVEDSSSIGTTERGSYGFGSTGI